jgi:tetratricopeptide (TPR) repeat protein
MLILLPLISLQLIYLFTVCPTVYLGDSGELTAAAFCLGIPHNSGYPLYALLGKLFCLIPLGNIGFRMNLMSTSFALATIWLVYSIIVKWTRSGLAGFVGAWFLAFSPLFWFQTVSAEVYTLHAFFVALLLRLLLWWDEEKEFYRLVVFVFLTGLSFGNHLQTVMLAPGVLWVVLCGDRRALLNGKRFLILSAFFVVALSVYVYLPIRTEAGAAIHWGDPNSLDRFMAHVSGRSHREVYVLSMTAWEYVGRAKEALLLVGSQFGIMILFAVWGWLKVGRKWQVLCVLVVFFDFAYTVFLNTISLEITAFNLPTIIVVSILVGVGIGKIIKRIEASAAIGENIRKMMKLAWCIIPLIGLMTNFGLCNQSRNYTAYEQGLNILMTAGSGDIILVSGDNYLFPVTYYRIVERAREDVRLYDRINLFFKLPFVASDFVLREKDWQRHRDDAEKRIIRNRGSSQVFYAIFGPYSIAMEKPYQLQPFGVLYRVCEGGGRGPSSEEEKLWRDYTSLSFTDHFYRDFMTREVCAYFYFKKGDYLIRSGYAEMGLRNMQVASEIAYDDDVIHTDMAVFLTDQGFFEQAQEELEKALIYHDDLSGVYNNWGYFYHKKGEHDKSVHSFRKAVQLAPDNAGYHNNLGFALFEAGRKRECLLALERSLALNPDQPEIKKFIEEKLFPDFSRDHVSVSQSKNPEGCLRKDDKP